MLSESLMEDVDRLEAAGFDDSFICDTLGITIEQLITYREV